MKKIILGLFSLLFCANVFAQSNSVKTLANTATDKLATLYQLSPDQTKDVLKIQERRYKHIEELQNLKASQAELYLKKRKSVEIGVNASMQRVLTDEQEVVLREQMKQQRTKKAVLRKKMYSEGASNEAIQEALLEME